MENKPYYVVCEEDNARWLQDAVLKKLKEGYELFGPPFGTQHYVCQALILKDKNG
jgi:hypothetical protein